MKRSRMLICLVICMGMHIIYGQQKLVVQVNHPGAAIQPTMWGVFFEDINFGADGGIYAELIKNRSFEFAQPLMGWTLVDNNRFSLNKESGSLLVINRETENAGNPHVGRVSVNTDKGFVISNEGFRGIGVKAGNTYNFSVWARQESGAATNIALQLVTPQGKLLGSCSIIVSGNDWKQ